MPAGLARGTRALARGGRAPVHARGRRRSRPGAAGRSTGIARVSEISPAGLGSPLDALIEVRTLQYPDLPEVLAVGRGVSPTPCSLGIFVLALSKQTGICLAATEPVEGAPAGA